MRNNIVEIWRRLYTLGEGFVEIDSETWARDRVSRPPATWTRFADKR
jgi:glycyl-tRNA synthetase